MEHKRDNNNKDNILLISVERNKTYTQKHEKNLLCRVTTDQSQYNYKGFKGRIILDLHY